MNSFKDIRLIALDLDDTTLRSDGSLADETKTAIETAIRFGLEVAIASGRAFNSLPREVTGISGIRYAITSNGAAVVRVPDGKRIVSLTLRENTVHRLIELFGSELLECFIDGQAYCDARYMADPVRYGCSEAYVEYVKTTRLPVENMAEFIRGNAARLDSVDVLCRSPEHRAELWERARELPDAYITSSSPRLIEISDAGAGKGASLRRLCAMLDVPASAVAAFGNGDNDADMLAFAGLGAAVKNATAACIAASDLVCGSNDEHGVAQTLYTIMGHKIIALIGEK